MRVTLATLSLQRNLPEMLRERERGVDYGKGWIKWAKGHGCLQQASIIAVVSSEGSPGRGCTWLLVPDGGVGTFRIRRITVGITEMQWILVAVLIRTQFAQRDLSLDPADGALFIRQAVGLRGDVDGDLRCVGQQLVQMFLLTGAELLQRAAVRVVTGVALLPVRHRQVLRAEGGVRLEAAHTAMRPLSAWKLHLTINLSLLFLGRLVSRFSERSERVQ